MTEEEFRTAIKNSLVFLRKDIAVELEKLNGLMYDYRLMEEEVARKSVPITFFSKTDSCPIATATLIYADDDVAKRIDVLQVDKSCLRRMTSNALLSPPFVIAGYATIETDRPDDRLSLARWYVRLMRLLIKKAWAFILRLPVYKMEPKGAVMLSARGHWVEFVLKVPRCLP